MDGWMDRQIDINRQIDRQIDMDIGRYKKDRYIQIE